MRESSRNVPSLPSQPGDAPGEVQILHAEAGVLFATWRNVSVAVWGAQATLPLLRKFGKITATLYRRYPITSNVTVILDDTPMPTPEARDAFVKQSELVGDRLACLALVFSGSGFWHSTLRSLLTNVHWVKPRPFVPRMHTSVAEAAAWLAPLHAQKTGVKMEPAELERVLAQLTARTPDA